MRPKLTDVVALCKRRGFVFPGSDVYGGLSGTFDYGPAGVELKRNVTNAWWRAFVTRRGSSVFGLDSGVLLSPKVWRASGHADGFTDPLCECGACAKRFRADHLLEAAGANVGSGKLPDLIAAVDALTAVGKWCCPECKSPTLSKPREFNLMFTTRVGPADGGEPAFFRPETAQGAYINLDNVAKAVRRDKLPFGVAQIGKAWRNEVTPGNFIFRTREFEQMELQWFCDSSESSKFHSYWLNECLRFAVDECGLNPENLRVRWHAKDQLAHYARATADIEYRFPFGWGELWGIADRGDHDVKAHEKASGQKLWPDAAGATPCVVEPSLGVNRMMLAILCDAMAASASPSSKRSVLRLPPHLAPFELAVFPVVTNVPALVDEATRLFDAASQWCRAADLSLDRQGVGKKYYRHDEIGTPVCVVVDDATLRDGTVSLRDRDSAAQIRVSRDALASKSAWDDAVRGLASASLGSPSAPVAHT